MMSKAVVIVAFLCVVSSIVDAYVAVNIYDNNDLDTERFSQGVQNCNALACNEACRRLGYPGGNCVNSWTCKCNPRRQSEVNEVQNTEPIVEEHNVNIKKANAVNELPLVRDCSSLSCRLSCKVGGYSDGYCIFGSCLCN